MRGATKVALAGLLALFAVVTAGDGAMMGRIARSIPGAGGVGRSARASPERSASGAGPREKAISDAGLWDRARKGELAAASTTIRTDGGVSTY